jgi:hypothetical protein
MPSDRVKSLIAEKLEIAMEELEQLDGRLDSDIKRWAETTPEVQVLLRKIKDRHVDMTDVLRAVDAIGHDEEEP